MVLVIAITVVPVGGTVIAVMATTQPNHNRIINWLTKARSENTLSSAAPLRPRTILLVKLLLPRLRIHQLSVYEDLIDLSLCVQGIASCDD
jgi:hypothetical protein